MYKTIVFAILLSSFQVANGNTVSCSHPEICRMAQIILSENSAQGVILENIIVPTGDPHEFEPSIQDVKKLMRAPTLLVGPIELNPWMKNISEMRSQKKDLKTFALNLPTFAISEYPTNESEALGHFWLYPQIYCHIKKSMSEILNYKQTVHCNFQNIEQQLASDLNKLSIPIVLTHDALLPLLNKLATKKNQIIAVKGSTHHGEMSAASIKKVYDALKEKRVIWIVEDNIAVSENIKNKIRKSDIIIKIDTAKSPLGNQDFSLLESFHKKLQEIKQ